MIQSEIIRQRIREGMVKELRNQMSRKQIANYGSLVTYLKSQKENPKINGKNENNIPLNIVEKE